MIWSFSAAKTFGNCQRQWYFKNCLADARAKDPGRHEAYLLSTLQSLKGWRGQLVDKVISEYVVPALNKRQPIHEHIVLGKARSLFDLQLDYAISHRVRESGMSKSNAGDAFAAFHVVEYGDAIGEQEITLAWDEIERSIDFDELEQHIATSVHEMLMVRGDAPASELWAEDFSASRSPWTCRYCPFRKLCWETSYVED